MKRIFIFCVVIILVFLQFGCKKSEENINSIAYISYSSDYEQLFSSEVNNLALQKQYQLYPYNCEKSSASALSNVTSAINSKIDYVIINYPDENICKQMADMLIEADIKYCIVNQNIQGYICYSLNFAAAKDQMLVEIKNKIAAKLNKPDLIIGLYSESAPKAEREMIIETSNELIKEYKILEDQATNEIINENPVNVKQYIINMLSDLDKTSKIIFICQNANVALGVRDAAKEMQIQDNVIVSNYNHAGTALDDTWCVAIQNDFSNLNDFITSKKSKSAYFNNHAAKNN